MCEQARMMRSRSEKLNMATFNEEPLSINECNVVERVGYIFGIRTIVTLLVCAAIVFRFKPI